MRWSVECLCASFLGDRISHFSHQQPHPSTDKAFTFVAEDFADEELKLETFCLMFRNAAAAAEFKENHDNARSANGSASGETTESGDGAAPAAAAAPEEKDEESPILFHNSAEGMYPVGTVCSVAFLLWCFDCHLT